MNAWHPTGLVLEIRPGGLDIIVLGELRIREAVSPLIRMAHPQMRNEGQQDLRHTSALPASVSLFRRPSLLLPPCSRQIFNYCPLLRVLIDFVLIFISSPALDTIGIDPLYSACPSPPGRFEWTSLLTQIWPLGSIQALGIWLIHKASLSQHPSSHLWRTLYVRHGVNGLPWISPLNPQSNDEREYQLPSPLHRRGNWALEGLDTCPKVTHLGNGGTWFHPGPVTVQPVVSEHDASFAECGTHGLVGTTDDSGYTDIALVLNLGMRFLFQLSAIFLITSGRQSWFGVEWDGTWHLSDICCYPRHHHPSSFFLRQASSSGNLTGNHLEKNDTGHHLISFSRLFWIYASDIVFPFMVVD